MNPSVLLIISAALLLLLGFWELVLCEGTHLGARTVIWLYNLTAGRYDNIKRYDPEWERRILGDSIANAIGSMQNVRLLDVGAGTGRAARSLFPRENFQQQLFCVEPAQRMLEEGRKNTNGWPVSWLRSLAVPLPFRAGCFDFILCLEVLEFTPNPSETVHELARVLRPGGWLLITNRVSTDAAVILGKTITRDKFPGFLEKNGFDSAETYPWQMDYDLIWAQKPASN